MDTPAPPNYGQRLRIGLLIPSVNTVIEPQMQALLPRGVTCHVTRLALAGASLEALQAMVADVESAARLVADAGVDLIAFHCTAASMLSVAWMESIARRIHAATQLPATTTGHAVRSALGILEARRVVLVTPYGEATHARELAFLAECGVEVVGDACMKVGSARAYAEQSPQVLERFALEQRHAAADAYFYGCTAIRSSEIIASLERQLERPVITSNQVLAWHVMRHAGIADHVPGYGRLLARH